MDGWLFSAQGRRSRVLKISSTIGSTGDALADTMVQKVLKHKDTAPPEEAAKERSETWWRTVLRWLRWQSPAKQGVTFTNVDAKDRKSVV